MLVLLLPLGGCASRAPAPATLVVISPHRDEIREETAQAFQDWFQARTQERAAAARAAVRAWLERDDADRGRAAVRAVEELLADWEEEDLPQVRAAFADWRRQANATNGQALLTALEQWRPRPVAIVWQDVGGTSQIVRYVRARFEANPESIDVDLLFGGGTDLYIRFADEELLQAVEVSPHVLQRLRPHLDGVPLYDPQRRWFGCMLSSFGILCNRRVLERIGREEPRTWDDLGRPDLQGWMNAGDPRLTGSVHMVYEIILQRPQGWDEGARLLLRLGANTHTFIRDSGTLARTVNNGDVAAAGVIDVNALSAVGRDPQRMRFHLPPGETIISPDAVAVLKGAPRKHLAQAFVEFTLSDAGQRLFFLQPGQPGGPRRHPLCRLSIVEKLYAEHPPEARSTGPANPFTAGKTIRYDNQRSIRRWDALNDLLGAWVVDAHPDLKAAWRAVLHSPLPEEERRRLEEELFRPPCTEEELFAYARAVAAGGPRVRAETLTRWGEEARQRYRRIKMVAGGE